MRAFFVRMLTITGDDPDDARRRGLLNILLAGLIVTSLVITVISVFALSQDGTGQQDIVFLFASSLIFFFLAGGLLLFNRRQPGTFSAWIFLLALLAAISFADNPEQLVDGRSIYLFTLPILVASFVLFPSASFILAGVSSIVVVILTPMAGLNVPNYFGMVGFFAIGLVAWLASNSMERALQDVRVLNVELDKRVEARTQELAQALARELAEAGKNQAILNGIADGVVVFDSGGQVIVANPSVCQLLEIPHADLLNINVEAFIRIGNLSESDSRKLHDLLAEPDKDIPSFRVTWGQTTISVTTAAVVTPLGVPIGTVAVFRDFTREAEVEKLKNTFVAMVSHELRTPLNAILAYSEMIKGEVYGPVTPKLASVAERIFSNTQRLINLVSDLLDQASLEAGKLKIVFEEFVLSEAVDTMHSIMDKPVRDKGLELNLNIEPDVPHTVVSDAHRFQQILINLVNNAVKFTKAGVISVRIYRPEAEHWAVEVADTGPGIPEEALPYIFDTFRQVDGVTTRQHGGVGLGLSIVKRLVELMGGTIKVSSVLNQGTVFTVTLPIKPLNTTQGEK